MQNMSSALVKEIIEWDVKNWSTSLDFWSNESTLNLSSCHALELGSRNGGLSLWLAKQGCKVICSDINGPNEQAKVIHAKHEIDHLISYSAVDATKIPYDNNSFDIVIFKSVLGGVGYNNNKVAQIQAINEIYRILRPGGELFFAENLIGSPLHTFLRNSFVKWGNSWRYITTQEMMEFLNPFPNKKFFHTGFLAALGRNEKQRSLISYFDKYVFNKISPNQWKYILIGLAQK